MNLNELKAICEKATDAPWYTGGDGADVFAGGTPPSYDDAIHIREASGGLVDITINECNDAKLIATARTAMPKLIEVAEAARNILNHLIEDRKMGFAIDLSVGTELATAPLDKALRELDAEVGDA